MSEIVIPIAARYWLFGWERHEACGGMSDAVGSFATLGEAQICGADYDHAEVLDIVTGQMWVGADSMLGWEKRPMIVDWPTQLRRLGE